MTFAIYCRLPSVGVGSISVTGLPLGGSIATGRSPRGLLPDRLRDRPL
ncbi:hypothetical protein SAMN04490239_1581 [Rhodococcus koreensis]|uniref:Uncharacterized protein n=1 Tax=Rhodococcus koreensis TaxID=99653 RepID=A0A1H4M1C4_9NOCA|nr:hypothetical protein SAMN04490239_1581 [Rhodococcus koreensis]